MAIYEYYCPTCRDKFEARRPMTEAAAPVSCKQGHRAERTISAFAMTRGGSDLALAEMPAGGGCCGGGGGGCACSN
jgi:putative FmdB family regulatory protein